MPHFLFLFLANLSSFLPAACLCVLFSRDCLKRPLWICLLAACALTIAYLLLDTLFLSETTLEYVGVFAYLLIAFLALRQISTLPPFKLLFLTMIVFNYYSFIVGINWGLSIPQNEYTILYNLFCIVFPGIPFYFLLYHVFWPMIRDITGSFYKQLWVVPFTFSIVLTLLANTIGFFSPLLYLSILVFTFLSAIIIIYILLRALTEAMRQTREGERAQAASAYLSLQVEQYELLNQKIASTRVLHHDLRHHLLVIKRHAQEKDFQGISAYCDRLTKTVAVTSSRTLCNNFAVNAVACHYDERAQAAGIHVDIELNINEDTTPIDERDLCVIIGNLLENAIEACERIPTDKRWLRMRCRMVASSLTIVMDNSFDGIFFPLNEEALSRKHEGTGIGLTSIRAIARKYNGDTAFYAKESTFQSSIYLPTRETQNN